MIRNNLALLMTQKRRRVNELANETGISRNTITSTAQNKGKMIQLSTINKLCQSLEVDPTAFFEYVPFDFDYTFDKGDLVPNPDYDHGKPETYEASLFINVSENNNRIDSIELQGYIDFEGQYDGDTIMIGTDLHPSDTIQLKKLNSYLGKMSVSFISDIKKDIEEVVESALNENSNVKVHSDLLIDFEETKEQYFTKLKNRNSNH